MRSDQPRVIRTRLVALAPGWWHACLMWSDGVETEGGGLSPVEAEMDAISPIPGGFTLAGGRYEHHGSTVLDRYSRAHGVWP